MFECFCTYFLKNLKAPYICFTSKDPCMNKEKHLFLFTLSLKTVILYEVVAEHFIVLRHKVEI